MDVHMSACRNGLPAVPPRVSIIGSARSERGHTVTFTALVDSLEAHGSIAFYSKTRSGPHLLGTVPLTDGHASLTTSFINLGRRKIHAIYMGEGRHARAMSDVIEHDVTEPTGLRRRRSGKR
jgi:hypothetical protein